MQNAQSPHSGMSLFSHKGERKYLNVAEARRFIKAISTLSEASEQTFCETIYWTGCRPSEALQLDIARVNVEDAFLVFRTLKKHGTRKGRHFRTVPIPRDFAKRLDSIHLIIKTQRNKTANQFRRLWVFGRQKGWNLIRTVMNAAKIFGIRACARGLRHSFGVHAILSGVPETQLQTWLGHSSLRTTAIYVSIIGIEDRSLAKRLWIYRKA